MTSNLLRTERGIASVIAILMVGMLLLVGIAAMNTSNDEVSVAGNQLQTTRAFYAAEAALEKASADIQSHYDSAGRPPDLMPAGSVSMNRSDAAYSVVDGGAAVQKTLTQGTLSGLVALAKSYTITATAVTQGSQARSVLTNTFEADLIPIFQFAVFYQKDLEIAPGPPMVLSGRVHTNGDLYLQSGNGLDMSSYVSSAGNLLYGRKGPGGGATGDVRIKNAAGTYVSMNSGGTWIDSKYATWYSTSTSMWNGKVQDKAHGQSALNLPLAGSGDPHKLIEPAPGNADSYENKATLKVVDNIAWQKQGSSWVNVTADMTAKGIITYTANQFTDQREGNNIDCTELDIQQLYNNGYGPSNGVIYFSDNITSGAEFPGLRIVNGSTLNAALTIASANPIYTKGDFNSVNKKPAALMADAVTFLSSAFDDAKSNLDKSNRVAQPTTVNAAYLTGNINTTASDYNGGFENLPRFLETWSGVDFNWKGSAICLWNSKQANGTWNGSYYDPPNRNWSFDTDFNDPSKLPPQTPMVRVFQRVGWSEQFVQN